MKKFFAVIAFLFLSVSAYSATMEVKGGYTYFEGGKSGLHLSPSLSYSLYTNEEGFVKGVDLGVGLDYTISKVDAFSQVLMIGPVGKLSMPYSYLSFGFGYNITYVKSTSYDDLAIKGGLGFTYPLEGSVKVGLDCTLTKLISGTKSYSLDIGPMVSFDL